MLDEGEAVMVDPSELEARTAASKDLDTEDKVDEDDGVKPMFHALTAAEMNVSVPIMERNVCSVPAGRAGVRSMKALHMFLMV